MDSLAGVASYEAAVGVSGDKQQQAHGGGGGGDEEMQVIDISEQCDSDSGDSVGHSESEEEDDDFLHRPLSPSNPFLLICNSLCSSPSSAASIHVQPLSLPPPSKQDSRIPLASLPDDLRAFLVAQQHPLVKDCEGESGLLPSWMTSDHVKLLTQLFDKHVAQHEGNAQQHAKGDWEEAERSREGKGRTAREEAAVKDVDMRGEKKGLTASSVSTSAATSSMSSSSSSFSASSQQQQHQQQQQQQASPLYSLHTTNDQPNPLPSSPHHYQSYTPPRPLPSTPVPPPLLSPSLSKQTSRIAETIRRLYGLSSEEKGHKLLGHCFPSSNTRVLTDAGFQFLEEVEARLAAGERVLYACYDGGCKALRYTTGSLVFPPEPPSHLIHFLSSDAAPQRLQSAQSAEASAHLLLRVTPPHRMLVAIDDAAHHTASSSLQLVPAESLLADHSHAAVSVRMLACAAAGHLPLSNAGERSRVQSSLGLREGVQWSAFLHLLGFWLSAGSLGYDSCRPAAVRFMQLDSEDCIWLHGLALQAGLSADDFNVVRRSESVTFLITQLRWLTWFDEQFGQPYASEAAECSTNVEEMSVEQQSTSQEPLSNAARMPSWLLLHLPPPELRLVIDGLRRAAGSPDHPNDILTSSAAFRDQLLQALLHCGFSPLPSLAHKAGSVRGYTRHTSHDSRRLFPTLHVQQLSRAEQANYFPVKASSDIWAVSWSDPSSPSSATVDSCWPHVSGVEGITAEPYSLQRDGRLWCVHVDHPDHLLFAQRAERLDGVVTQQSRPVITGNSCLTPDDQTLALEHKSDLLYGEVLPEGVSRMFDSEHLDLMTARTVYDLGSGLGKLAMQAFLQFPHLDWVCGVELARSRSLKGFEAVRKLSKLRLTSAMDSSGSSAGGAASTTTVCSGVIEEGKDGNHVRLTETLQSTAASSSSYKGCLGRKKSSKKHRYFELRCADLFTVHDAFSADVVICETKFPEEKYRDLAHFMSHMKQSVRVLTYEDLDAVYAYTHMQNPFVRLDNNHTNDRFYTTWAPNYGYRFHLWRKRGEGGGKGGEEEKREEKQQFKQE